MIYALLLLCAMALLAAWVADRIDEWQLARHALRFTLNTPSISGNAVAAAIATESGVSCDCFEEDD